MSRRSPNHLLDCRGRRGRATPLWLTGAASGAITKAPSLVVFAGTVQTAGLPQGGSRLQCAAKAGGRGTL